MASLSDNAARYVFDALHEKGWLIAPSERAAIDEIQRGLDKFIDAITEK